MYLLSVACTYAKLCPCCERDEREKIVRRAEDVDETTQEEEISFSRILRSTQTRARVRARMKGSQTYLVVGRFSCHLQHLSM